MNLKNKRMIIFIIVMMVVAFLPMLIVNLIYSSKTVDFGTSNLYQEAEVKSVSTEIVNCFTAKEYQKVLDEYLIEEGQAKLSVDDIQKAVTDVAEEWGTYQEITTISLTEMKQGGKYYAMANVDAKYANVNVSFNFIFDQNMKLVGINLQNSDTVEK